MEPLNVYEVRTLFLVRADNSMEAMDIVLDLISQAHTDAERDAYTSGIYDHITSTDGVPIEEDLT